MASTTPLLNSYKTDFVLRRLPRTLLGGLNLKLGYSAPFYVYASQIILWLMPWFFGGIFTLATEFGRLEILTGSIVTGVQMGLFVFIIQGIYLCNSLMTSSNEVVELTASQQLRQLISDDDEIYFDSFCSKTTLEFIVPPKKFRPNIILHAIFSGVLCGLGFWYSLPTQLNIFYSTESSIAVYIFSWVVICIAQFPLTIGGSIPEVATFNANDDHELNSSSRPFHVFILFCVQLAQIYNPSLLPANQVLHIVFCALPLLWLSGILPPIDALLLWSFEQFHIFGLGATSMATNKRSLFAMVISASILLVGCFMPSAISLVLFTSILSFILSVDFVSFLQYLFHKLAGKCNKNWKLETLSNLNLTTPHLFLYVSMFFVNIPLTCLFVLNTSTIQPAKTAFHAALIALLCVCKLLKESQKVYVFFRLFRNLFYPQSFSEPNNFQRRKRVLSMFGYINMAFLYIINPLVMTTYLSAFLFADVLYFPSFLNSMAALHAFRMIWQRSCNALLNLAVVGAIEIVSNQPAVDLGWFETTSLGVRLLVVDICVDRAARFVDNLWFMFALLMSTWTDSKQKRGRSTAVLTTLNVVFLPVTVAVAATAGALSAPLLPLFTLPLFCVGFPRPARFWPRDPGSAPASTCPDTLHYSYSVEPLVQKLNLGFRFGVYQPIAGHDLPFLVARSQDRTFWVQTLESGYGYTGFNVKGLELQETSCHALEATRVEDQCLAAFEKSGSKTKRFNPYPFLSLLTPVDTVFVDGYSDVRNSLIGIIDNPAAIRNYHKDFVKVFVVLFAQLVNTKQKEPAFNSLFLNDEIKTPKKQHENKIKHNSTNKADKNLTLKKKSNKLDLDSGSLGSLGDILSSRSNSQLNVAKKSKNEGSVISLSSLLSNDDDPYLDIGNKPLKNRDSVERNGLDHPGFINTEFEDNFSDSGFSFQETKISSDNFLNENGSFPMTPFSAWDDLPLTFNDLKGHSDLFDQSWFLHVTSLGDDLELNSGAEEDTLLEMSRLFSLACYHIVNVLGVPGKDPSQLGAAHLCKVFSGEIPWSPAMDWLSNHPDLLAITLTSHRYAVKMMYESVAMGMLGEENDYDETMESIREYEQSSFVGLESSPGWREAIEKGKDSLFSLSYDKEKNEYTSHVLIKRPIETHISLASSAAIRAMWANLSLELMYATNDDEERYSIQAHQSLLRNLTTQAADSPLGYPIYSSKPILKQV